MAGTVLRRSAQRFAWALALASLALACAEAPVVQVDAPLFVFHSYPASGATVWRPELTELAFVLSQDLGEARHGRVEGARAFSLEGPAGPVAALSEGLTNVAWDGEAQLLRIVLEPEVLAALPAGAYTARLARGLVTEAGVVMPLDFVARFRLVDPPEVPADAGP